MDDSKSLGIIGGMGPQATQVFYQWILDRTVADTDQDHVPTFILSDTHMPDRTKAILSGNTAEVYDRLLHDAKILEKNGCSYIAIPCNTSHYFVDDLQKEISVPILHMPRLTVKKLAETGKKKAAILATTGTVKTGVYHKECESFGVEAWTPDDATQEIVMDIIYNQIKRGEQGDRHDFAKIDAAVRAAGCDCAILGCTELSVYRGFHDLPEYYIDAMDVLVENCILAFGKELRLV